MKQCALATIVLLLSLFVSCEKGSQGKPEVDWDLQPADNDTAVTGDKDTGGSDTGQEDLPDETGDEVLDEASDESSDEVSDEAEEEPQPDGDQPAAEQQADKDSVSDDAPAEDTDAPVTDEDVSDELLTSDEDTDEIFLTNHRPVADAGPDLTALIGYKVKIDASKSYDFDQDTLFFYWTVISQPAGSAIELDVTDTKKPTFVPAVKGIYTIRLLVYDGKEYSAPDTISVNVAGYVPMNFEIVDSAYSKSLDSIVFVSEEPKNMVYIYDIATSVLSSIALPLIPLSVSVSPDGYEAVVGHNGWFSHIDLLGKKRVATYGAKTVAYDVVFGPERRIYVFPDISTDLLVFNVDTGEEIARLEGFGKKVHAGRHPSAARLIAINEESKVISLLDIGVMPPEELTRIQSVFPIGNDLWVAENGTKIFTQAGSVFFPYDLGGPDEDLIYMGRLEELEKVKHLHNLGAVGRTVAIPESPDDIQLNLYDDPFMEYEKSIKLPAIILNEVEYQYHGKVVYFNQDDTKIITVISLRIGTVNNYALAIIENF